MVSSNLSNDDTPVNPSSSPSWTPPPRPEWVRQLNEEGASMDLAAVVPLNADELIATACRCEGLSNFGEDYWREPFGVLVKALDQQAELHLLGRLMIRDDLLRALRGRLQIEATYQQHPEIEDEIIDTPVVVVGLPRSGTSILFEILSQDRRFGPLLSWEIEYPCPPPEAATYESDPRIERAERLLTRQNRVAPSFKSIHELGACIPTECIVSFMYSFTTERMAAYCDVPDYAAYLATQADWLSTYAYHRRVLKLLQWKNPRRNWLLKAPSHTWYLETLFAVFPDAKVIHAHRDPLRANASGHSLIGTLRWIRSDKPFDADSFAQVLRPEVTAAGLERVIEQIETGKIPRQQIFNSRYAELMRDPLGTIDGLYRQMHWELDDETRQRIRHYLDHKPKAKFGVHQYKTVDDPKARACFERYQRYYGVENEH